MYSVTGAPLACGQAQESLKEEEVMPEGVGGGGARGGAGRVVAVPAVQRAVQTSRGRLTGLSVAGKLCKHV